MIDLKEIEEITGSDWPKAKELIELFDKAAGSPYFDRNNLAQIAKGAFKLELKYVPQLSANKKALEKLPAGNLCLVSSVGMRIEPVLLNIAILKPKSIVLVHTEESKDQVERIKSCAEWKDLFNKKAPFTVEIEIDPIDTTKCYEQLANVVKRGKKSNWVIDITGGRKIMGATLAAFGFWRRIPIVYLNAVEVAGIAKPFSERLHQIENPYDRYGDPLLKAAEDAFNNHQFAIAIHALEELRTTVSVIGLDHLASVAIEIIECYMLWDRFEHSNDKKEQAERFYKKFYNAVEQYHRFDYRFLNGDIEKNQNFIKDLEESYKERVSICDEYRLADIFCNALRKAEQNLFDDAVARLYRCSEMAATILLKELVPEFNPSDANWDMLREKFPAIDLDQIFKEKSKDAPDKIEGLPTTSRLGLAQQITLAATLAEAIEQTKGELDDALQETINNAHKVYEIYREAKKDEDKDKDPFALRNQTILAHGTKPANRQLYEKFKGTIALICECVVTRERWNSLIKQATFPAMRLIG